MLEGAIERKVKDRFKSTGWFFRKVTYQGRRGSPDQWFFGPGARMCIIEFKATGKKPRTQQRLEHQRFLECGIKIYVVDSLESGYALHAALEKNRAARLEKMAEFI